MPKLPPLILNPRRVSILQFIAETLSNGYLPPSYDEVIEYTGLARATLHYHIQALRQAGYLNTPEGRTARSITLTDRGWEAAGVPRPGDATEDLTLPAIEDAEAARWPMFEKVLLLHGLRGMESPPSMREIAASLGVAPSTVHRYVQDGCDQGYLEVRTARRGVTLTADGEDHLFEYGTLHSPGAKKPVA